MSDNRAQRMHDISDEARAVVDEVLDYARRRALYEDIPLDKPLTPLRDDLSARYSMQTGRPGVVVFRVQPGSAAERAGIRGAQFAENGGLLIGDVILDIEGRPIRKGEELFTTLGRFNVGDKVTVTVLRGREEIKIPVTLDAGAQYRQ